jgi:hypothetical protein
MVLKFFVFNILGNIILIAVASTFPGLFISVTAKEVFSCRRPH